MTLKAWHALTDSDAFRWVVKRGPGRAFFRSDAFKTLNVARNRLRSRAAELRHPHLFDDVEAFCFFVGHNKSGSSLLGSLLDAHADVVLSDEVDALQYVEAGFPSRQIFHMILKGSQAEARKGRVTARRLDPYSYAVPGSWQGRVRAARVVGDSTTGTTTRRIASQPDLLDRVQEVMGATCVKVLHVIRNPFDPISVMMVRGKRSFDNSIDHYFTSCKTLARVRRDLGPDALLSVRYEEVVAAPDEALTRVCRFLGVEAEAEYLERCAGIVRAAPDRSREMVGWTPSWIDHVHKRIAEFDFLRGYTYEH